MERVLNSLYGGGERSPVIGGSAPHVNRCLREKSAVYSQIDCPRRCARRIERLGLATTSHGAGGAQAVEPDGISLANDAGVAARHSLKNTPQHAAKL